MAFVIVSTDFLRNEKIMSYLLFKEGIDFKEDTSFSQDGVKKFFVSGRCIPKNAERVFFAVHCTESDVVKLDVFTSLDSLTLKNEPKNNKIMKEKKQPLSYEEEEILRTEQYPNYVLHKLKVKAMWVEMQGEEKKVMSELNYLNPLTYLYCGVVFALDVLVSTIEAFKNAFVKKELIFYEKDSYSASEEEGYSETDDAI